MPMRSTAMSFMTPAPLRFLARGAKKNEVVNSLQGVTSVPSDAEATGSDDEYVSSEGTSSGGYIIILMFIVSLVLMFMFGSRLAGKVFSGAIKNPQMAWHSVNLAIAGGVFLPFPLFNIVLSSCFAMAVNAA